MMDNTEKAILCEEMAEYIEQHGHCQWKLVNTYGEVCILGAGRFAQGMRPEDEEWDSNYYDTLADWRTAEALEQTEPRHVVGLNDVVLKEKDKVIEHLISQAKHWREKG